MSHRTRNDVDEDDLIYDDDALDDIHDRSGSTSDVFGAERWHRVVCATAFLIPFGVLALIGLAVNRYRSSAGDDSPVAVVVSPSPVPTVTGAWPQDVTFIPNTVPAIIRDDLPTAAARRGYRFEGHAGEVWHITVEPEDTLDPQIRLYEPSGGELAYNDDRSAGDRSAEIQVILPADGTYRLLVESAPKSGGTTGTYWLTVFGE